MALATEPPAPGRPVLALLTRVEGEVRLAAADGSRERPARLLQAVAEGDRLELAPGARVTLLCANASVHRLEQTRPLGAELCRDEQLGRAAAAGGLELYLGSLELIGEARGDGAAAARWLARMKPPDPQQLRRALEAIDRLGLDPQTKILTQAAIYAATGLLRPAATLLEPAAQTLDSPAIRRLLAKVRSAIELAELPETSSDSSYRSYKDACGFQSVEESSRNLYGLPKVTEQALESKRKELVEARDPSYTTHAWLWFERAVLLARSEEIDGARHAIGKARALAKLADAPMLEAEILLSSGERFNELQFYEVAAWALEEAIKILIEIPVAENTQQMHDRAHLQLVIAYSKLGLTTMASQHKNVLKELASHGGSEENLAMAEMLLAGSLVQQSPLSKDKFARFIEAMKRFQTTARESGDPNGALIDQQVKFFIDLLETLEREDDPGKIGEYIRQQAQAKANGPGIDGFLSVLAPMAEQLVQGTPEQGLIELEKSVRTLTQYHELPMLVEAQRLISSAVTESFLNDRPFDAASQCEKAIDLFESYVNHMSLDETMISFLDETAAQFYPIAVSIMARADRPADAFSYAERGRAWVLRRLLTKPPRKSLRLDDRELLDPVRRTGSKIAAKVDGQGSELKEQRDAFEASRLRQKISSIDVAHLPVVPAISLKELQTNLLPPQTALLAYFSGFEAPGISQFWVWVVDRKSVKSVSVRLTAGDLQDLTCEVDALHWQSASAAAVRAAETRGARPLTWCQPRGEPSTVLYRQLIAPVAPYLEGVRHLIVVPHGQLHYVPFAALRNPETGRYLVQDFTLSLAPSASALALLLQRASVPGGSEEIVMGDPVTGLGPLIGARQEASAIAAFLGSEPQLGERATEGRVYEKAGNIRLLHLAAHGQLESENPSFSRVLLGADGEHDGALEMHEVWDGLNLRGTELVVLSGCETALGKVTGGDEVLSLPHAFFVAGSRAVMSTLWRVDDEASAQLMIAFYEKLVRGGLTVAEALQKAQIARIASGAAPYTWAGFILTGDPDARWQFPAAPAAEPGRGRPEGDR